jgi:hypothetical protein
MIPATGKRDDLNPATPIEPGLKAPAVSLDETSS